MTKAIIINGKVEFRDAVEIPANGFLKARIGRRIRLSPEARKAWRRKTNAAVQRQLRKKRVANGLRSDGKPRKRNSRERVIIQDVRLADNGEIWLRISAANAPRGTPPLRKFKIQTAVILVFPIAERIFSEKV